ncbi:hypothetical protein B0H11DRAFT_2268113 [Mycena galericulata]|nr:hypothetical protein B0H11DRAFT_2268113 [Mycena galericulata]
MSTARIHETKRKKPPACDICKARRVLCHPQPNGAPCPRCVENDAVCTTTPVPRGRPRKVPIAVTSSLEISRLAPQLAPSLQIQNGPLFESSRECPDLKPDFISHCFQCLQLIPQYNHPLIESSGIIVKLRTASFQLDLLPFQTRVLALCIIALASLASFHESVLGDGPRPASLSDFDFFFSSPDVAACGVRRGPAYSALRTEAFKAAWEAGIMLQPSAENAASCYFLDLLEQLDICGPSRPWANAYISHMRALAPNLRAQNFTPVEAGRWAGFYMAEALRSTRGRTPMLFTLNDQLLLFGSEPPPLESLLTSLEASADKLGLSVLWTSINSYMFHIPCLARQLYETINGDNARLNPLSEAAIIRHMSALSLLHSIVALLLARIDGAITSAATARAPFHMPAADKQSIARVCGYGIGLSFAVLVLPFYRELAARAAADTRAPHGHASVSPRAQVLRAQARDMATGAARELARVLRYLPALHFTPMHAETVLAWAEFCVEDADADADATRSPETVRDLQTELKLLAYSLGSFSAPPVVALIQRLESFARAPLDDLSLGAPMDDDSGLFDPVGFGDMFGFPLSMDGTWMPRSPAGENDVGLFGTPPSVLDGRV